MNIVMIGFGPDEAGEFEAALAAGENVALKRAESEEAGKELFKSLSPRLAVIGPKVANPRVYLGELMMINAMAYTVVSTAMSEKEFHDALEGLGVLMPLPESPSAEDAAAVLEQLSKMA